MSLGSFVRGAFSGYEFGENVKDRKTERERNKERFEWERGDQEWRGESRDRQRDEWGYTDEVRARQRKTWNRADEKLTEMEETEDELDRIREDGYSEWKSSQNSAPVPENTAQGTMRAPLAEPDRAREPVPGAASPSVPGIKVQGINDRNPDAQPLRFGNDVPTASEFGTESFPAGRQTGPVRDAQGNIVLTDIEPVRGTYSEEEQRQIEREARTTALTPNANDRRATDYPYNPSSPEQRDGIMQPGGQPRAPRPDDTSPGQPPYRNAIDPAYRAPIFSEMVAPAASRRAPSGPVSPDTIAAEAGGEDIRDSGATTYGGGAQPRPSTPGMPVDPRAPTGPEGGAPQRQAARNARTVLGDSPRTSLAPVPEDTQQETGTLEAPQAPERSTRQNVRDVDPNASAFMQDVQEFQRKGDIEGAIEEISVGLATGKYGAAGSPLARTVGAVGDYFTGTPEEGQAAAAERQRTADALQWYKGDEARALFTANPDLLTAAAQDPIAFREQQGGAAPATAEAPQPGQGAASAAEPPRPAPQQGGAQPRSGAGQPQYGNLTASQAAQFQNLPEPRMSIEDGGQPISMARASLAENANADNKGQPVEVSEQERAQGASTFQEYYRAEVVPRQIEALYQRGEIETADQMQAWLDDERSQALQENYARAVHAASIGDERGFFDYMSKVYNGFDDGYRFIGDESDLFNDPKRGTVAKITLENTQTGERFTQEYEGGEELIKQALTQMDPTTIFQTLKAKAEAEAAAMAEQRAWEIGESRRRIEEGYETEADRRQVYTDAYEALSEADPMGWPQLSAEEQDMAVLDYLRRAQRATSRGTSDPRAPVYLGQ